jgi:acyl dehydratase
MTQTHVEPFVGQVVGPGEVTVTPQLLATYRGGLAVEPQPYAPQMLANAFETTLLFSQQRGHLWLRQEWELHRPLQPGATYTVETHVTDIYPRRDRTILLSETALRDADGALVSRQRHHQSFLLDNPPAGEVTLRDPAAKEGARRELPPIGRELASLDRTVTLEMCGEFFYGSKNYHSDRQQSEALGFRDVVVGGRMTMGYIGELLDTCLGERWARTGQLLVKFTNVLWPEECIRVTVGFGEPGEDASRETVLGRVEKADGTVVVVAEGSVARA